MSGALGKSESQAQQQAQQQARTQSDAASQQQFDQNVWAPQGQALQNMYGNINGLFGNTIGNSAKGNTKGGTSAAHSVFSPLSSAMSNNMAGGAYQNLDLQNQFTDSINQSANNPSAMQQINSMIMGGSGNNYADAMRDQYIADANRAQQLMLRNLDARASAAGHSGQSPYQRSVAEGMYDINRNLQRNLAETGYSTFEKDLDRKLGIASQADANTFQRQQLLSNMIGNQQGTMNQGYNQGLQLGGYGQSVANIPWQQAQMYGSLFGAPTVLNSGSGSSKQSSKGEQSGSSSGFSDSKSLAGQLKI